MHVFIDESGSFTSRREHHDFCGVGALAIADAELAGLEARCATFCKKFGGVQELKGRDLNEPEIGQVLRALSVKDAVLEVVFIDSGQATDSDVETFVRFATDHVDSIAASCHHEQAQRDWRSLADEVRALPLQLVRQVYTVPFAIAALIRTAVPFFARHRPHELARFSWTYDSKGAVGQTGGFDGLLKRWMLPVLQAEFSAHPLISIREFDYSHMSWLKINERDMPGWLPPPAPSTLLPRSERSGFDLGRMVRDDFAFTTSEVSPGLQFADVAVSAIRRAIRGNLQRRGWIEAAPLLAWDREPPIRFIKLDPKAEDGGDLAEVSTEMMEVLRDLRRGARRVFG
jgi:Protein of unknown function (DUF3800)